MNRKQAEEKGYSSTGVYSKDREVIKLAVKEEKKKGNKAVTVSIPPNKYSRGHHGTSHSMFVMKSAENIKKDKIGNCQRRIERVKNDLDRKRQEVKDLEIDLVKMYTELNNII